MSLSDKIRFELSNEIYILKVDDVREAVKELRKAICICGDIDKTKCCYCGILDEIFGEKLI